MYRTLACLNCGGRLVVNPATADKIYNKPHITCPICELKAIYDVYEGMHLTDTLEKLKPKYRMPK